MNRLKRIVLRSVSKFTDGERRLAESKYIGEFYRGASRFARPYNSWNPHPNRAERELQDSMPHNLELGRLSLLGDGIVALGVAQAVLSSEQFSCRTTRGGAISNLKSNRVMSNFSLELGLFDDIVGSDHTGSHSSKKRGDLFEGWLGKVSEVCGGEYALSLARVYTYYTIKKGWYHNV